MIDSNNATTTEVSSHLRQTSNYETVKKSIIELIDRQNFFWLVTTYNCVVKYYKRISQYLTKQISDYDLNSQNRKTSWTQLLTVYRLLKEIWDYLNSERFLKN